MKKLLTLLCLCCLCIGSAWGESFSETYKYEESSGPTTWSLTQYCDKGSYYLVPEGTYPSVASFTGIFANKTITSDVVVTLNVATFGNGTNPTASTFSIYNSSDCSNQIIASQGGTLPSSSTFTNVTYTIAQVNAASFTKDLAIKITKPGKQIRLKSITIAFTYTPSKTLSSIVVSGTPTKTEYEAGESFDPTGLVVTGTYDDATTSEITEGIEWTINPSTLTTGTTSVSVTATVNGVTSEAYTVSGLTVNEHVVTPGTYEIVPNNALWGTSYNGIATGATSLSGSQNDVSIVLNKNSSGSAMYVNDAQTRAYSNYTMIFSVPEGYEIKTITFTANGDNWKGTHTADVGTMSDSKHWEGSEQEVTITFDGTCQITSIQVTYGTPTVKTLESIVLDGTYPTEFYLGQPFSHEGIVVTAKYEEEDVTDVVVTSNVSFSEPDMTMVGEQQVTVSYTEGETTKTVEYTITVKSIANTQGTAYTVAEAKAIIDANPSELATTNVYVKGTVSKIDSYNSAYNSITYWISKDGETTNQFQVYGGLKSNSEDNQFTSKDDLTVGDDVVVYGIIKKYSSTYEFDKNNYIVSILRKTTLSIDNVASATLNSTITPTVYTNRPEDAISYSSSDESVVKLVDGQLKAVGVGTATITATLAATEEYKEATTTFTVTVIKSVTSIAVKTAPAKVEYKEGEKFDPTGLVITRKYDDNSTDEVAYSANAGFTFNPALTEALTTENTSVTIAYASKETSQSISVRELCGYTITWDVNGDEETETFKEDATLELPEQTPSIEGYDFFGWSETEVSSTTEKPTILGDVLPTVTANKTYYAVFKRAEQVEATTPEAYAVGDEGYYVIAAYVAGKWYALPTNPTVNGGKITAKEIAVTTVGDVKYVTENNAEGFKWTIEKLGSYYTISDGTKYIYHSNGGNSGTNLTYGNSISYLWKFTEYGGGIQMAGVSVDDNKYFEHNRGMLFNGTTIAGYSLSNSSSSGYYITQFLPIASSTITTYTTTIIAPVTVTLKGAYDTGEELYYATFFATQNMKIDDYSAINICKVTDDTAELIEMEDSYVIPTGAAVVLTSLHEYIELTATTETSEYEDFYSDPDLNDLVGYAEDTQITGSENVSYYALNYKTNQEGGKQVGFFAPKGASTPNGSFTAKANKAYLKLDGQVQVKAFYTFGGNDVDVDAINSINADKKQMDGAIYNLNGQRLNALQKGINIVNGKKIVIK